MVDLLLIRARDSFVNPDKPPNLGLIAIASYVRAHGHGVRVMDMNLYDDPVAQFVERVAAVGAGVIGISAMYHQFPAANELGHLCRERLSARIVSGGMHFTIFPRDGLTYGHAVIAGEGEKAMVELMEGGGENMRGIIAGAPLENLDDIPLPDDDIIDATTWSKTEYSLMTGRGCPFNCLFCLRRDRRTRKLRYHSPEYVCDYMERVIHRTAITRFFFVDDIFILDKERVFKICDEIERRDIGVQLRCFGHANIADLEMFERMKEVGFYEIQVGVESGSQKILNLIRKSTTLERIERTIALIKEAGLSPLALFMIGNIGENKETVRRSISFAEKLGVRSWFSYALPLPGTEFYDVARRYGRIIRDDWQLCSNEDLAYVPSGLDEKTMRSLMKKARRIRHAVRSAGRASGVDRIG